MAPSFKTPKVQLPALALFLGVLLSATTGFAADVSVMLYVGDGPILREGTVQIYRADNDGYRTGEPIQITTRSQGEAGRSFDFSLREGDYVVHASLIGFRNSSLPIHVEDTPLIVRMSLEVGQLVDGDWQLKGQIIGANLGGRSLWISIQPFLQREVEYFNRFTATPDAEGRFDFGHTNPGLYILNVFEDSPEEDKPPSLIHSQLVETLPDS